MCGALPPRRLATIVQKKSYLLFAVLRFVSFILLNLFTFVSFFVFRFSVFVFQFSLFRRRRLNSLAWKVFHCRLFVFIGTIICAF